MRQFLPRRIISICRLSEEEIPPVSIPIAAVTKMMSGEFDAKNTECEDDEDDGGGGGDGGDDGDGEDDGWDEVEECGEGENE